MSLNKYFSDLQEKITSSTSMGDVIRDFQKSDAPQFKGKSQEKRREMAIAAKLGAERGQQNETSIINLATKGRIKMPGDMGEPSYAARKKATNLQQKIVDKKYINKIVGGAEGGITTNTGLVPEETKKTGKDDLPFEPDENTTNKDEFGNTIKDRARHIARKAMKKAAEQGKGFGPSPADKLSIRKNEAFEFGKSKYKKSDWRDRPPANQGKKDNYADFAHLGMNSDVPASKKEFKKQELKHELRKEEVEELDELDQKTLRNFTTRAKFSSDPKHREAAAKAQEKLNKKSKDMQKEEAEQVDEVSADVAKRVAQRRDQDFRKMTPTETQKRRMARGDWRADPSLQADKAYKSAVKRGAKDVYGYNEEVEELDEALRHQIAGAVAGFLGNKIDPLHGQIMQKHGEEAYRQAATHIRKVASDVKNAVSDLHDQLHHHLRTGKPIKLGEEVELEEETSPMIKAPKNEFAMKSDAFARAKKQGGKVMKKTFTHPTTGQQHVSYVVKEEVELEEDGKLKGGAKDPCWKGYQMVGTKKKNGREVPNCVPREEKEYKTFKALKEELNGNSNRS